MLQSEVGVGWGGPWRGVKHLSGVRVHSGIEFRPRTVTVHVPARKRWSTASLEIENRIHVTQHFGVVYTEDGDPRRSQFPARPETSTVRFPPMSPGSTTNPEAQPLLSSSDSPRTYHGEPLGGPSLAPRGSDEESNDTLVGGMLMVRRRDHGLRSHSRASPCPCRSSWWLFHQGIHWRGGLLHWTCIRLRRLASDWSVYSSKLRSKTTHRSACGRGWDSRKLD